MVARIGGDEFFVLARLGHDPTRPQRVGDRLAEALSRPINAQGITMTVGLSVGICQIQANLSVAESIRLADQAAMKINREGGGAQLVST